MDAAILSGELDIFTGESIVDLLPQRIHILCDDGQVFAVHIFYMLAYGSVEDGVYDAQLDVKAKEEHKYAPRQPAAYTGEQRQYARQHDAIRRAEAAIQSALRGLRAGLTPDAVLTDVEAAMEAMGEVTGATVREDITARIFERFCVGK